MFKYILYGREYLSKIFDKNNIRKTTKEASLKRNLSSRLFETLDKKAFIVDHENNFSNSLSIWYRVLKFVSYFMIIAYVLDLFLGYRIASYICQIYNSKSVNVNSGRFISIYD